MSLRKIEKREKIYVGFVTTIPIIGMLLFIRLLLESEIRAFEWISFFCFYLIGEIGAEAGHHRYFSHRAFEANRPLKIFLAIAASVSGKGSIFEFAAVHRKHHKYTDRENDPHSPHLSGTRPRQRVRGFLHAYYGWIYRTSMNPAEHARVLDLLKDEDLVKFANRRMYYVWLLVGVLLPGILALAWYGDFDSALRGCLISGLVRLFFQQHTAFLINSICHIWGDRPFQTSDRSTNNTLLAFLTLGVGWHNNHHAFPYTAYNSFHWWQIDVAGWFIRTCELVGLASNCQFPTQAQINAKKAKSR